MWNINRCTIPPPPYAVGYAAGARPAAPMSLSSRVHHSAPPRLPGRHPFAGDAPLTLALHGDSRPRTPPPAPPVGPAAAPVGGFPGVEGARPGGDAAPFRAVTSRTAPRFTDLGGAVSAYGSITGTGNRMSGARKVKVQLPADLLDRAQRSSGKNLTATICQGLRLVAAGSRVRGIAAARRKGSLLDRPAKSPRRPTNDRARLQLVDRLPPRKRRG